MRVEVRGALAAILTLAAGAQKVKRPSICAEALSEQVKLVAGIGNLGEFRTMAEVC